MASSRSGTGTMGGAASFPPGAPDGGVGWHDGGDDGFLWFLLGGAGFDDVLAGFVGVPRFAKDAFDVGRCFFGVGNDGRRDTISRG